MLLHFRISRYIKQKNLNLVCLLVCYLCMASVLELGGWNFACSLHGLRDPWGFKWRAKQDLGGRRRPCSSYRRQGIASTFIEHHVRCIPDVFFLVSVLLLLYHWRGQEVTLLSLFAQLWIISLFVSYFLSGHTLWKNVFKRPIDKIANEALLCMVIFEFSRQKY